MINTKIYAAYLPQYHETKDNNMFWGEGFTDWVSVKNAKPMFEGHEQPKVPLNDNYYDLSNVSIIKWQAKLAKNYGIDGFNIYHYWFKNGKQELEKPAELLLENKDIDIDFFFTWDNSSWRRTWGNVKGNDWAPNFDKAPIGDMQSAMLIEFDYGNEEQWKKHFDYLIPFFKDERYLKIKNKPVFMFMNTDEVETLKNMGNKWDEWAKEAGFNGMYLSTRKKMFFSKPVFETEFLYEPVMSGWGKRRTIENKITHLLKLKSSESKDVKYKYTYNKIWEKIIRNAKKNKGQFIPGSFVRYDDTPRRGKKAAVILGESPQLFKKYLIELYAICCSKNIELLLLTAWNEWGEGAYIEPDSKNGFKYLEAIKDVKNESMHW